jgi:pimeloyl-ACP methyl ester carboxylesterase
MIRSGNGGRRLAAIDEGPTDGPLVILLHGFPEFSYAWRNQVGPLVDDGWRVLVPDQLGYNLSDKPVGLENYDIDALADDVLRLAESAGYRTFSLVGHDWGGIVAWGLGAWHRDRVRTLTAVSVPHPAAMTRAFLTSDQALRSYHMGLFQLPFLPERLILANDGRPLRAMLRRGGLPDDAVDRYVSRMREPGALTAALGWYRALPWSARDPVGAIRGVPTLHVWSTDDAFLGRAATEATEQFCKTQYRLEVLDGVSHWVPELAADRLAELITGHVRSQTAAE